MNRTGLVIALLVGVVVGVVFGVYPQLDIAISRLFFDETHRVFPVQYSMPPRHLRDVFTYIIAALVAPCVYRARVQAFAAAPAHADRRPRGAVPDRDAGARPRSD